MKFLKVFTATIGILLIIVSTSLFLIGYLKPKPGALLVEAVNKSNVYVDGAFVGVTPYKGTYEEGQIGLKVGAFETRVGIVSGVQTVVKPGEILSFERIKSDDAPIKITTTPNDALILIDGTSKGFAPYEISNLTPAEHVITVRAQGYADRVETVRNVVGYRLVMVVQLEKEEKKPEPTPAPKVTVKILDTPNGFLRVRTEPGTAGSEIGQARPGEEYPFLQEDLETGWYQIQFEATQSGLPQGILGWISNQYAEKLEASESAVLNPAD